MRPWNGAITSGYFWNGFYGRKSLPLFESATVGLGLIGDVVQMQHDGRFFMRDKVTDRRLNRATTIALSFPKKTVFFDDPLGSTALPDEFVLSTFELPWFRIEECWLNWPKRNLLERIQNEHQVIEKLTERARQATCASMSNSVWTHFQAASAKIRSFLKRK